MSEWGLTGGTSDDFIPDLRQAATSVPPTTDDNGRVLLWRGVDSGVTNGFDFSSGNPVSKIPQSWDEAQANMDVEGYTYGHWWDHKPDVAHFYAEEPGGHVVGAWFSPDDVVHDPAHSQGVKVRPGAQGEIEDARVFHQEHGWRSHPDARGKTITAGMNG